MKNVMVSLFMVVLFMVALVLLIVGFVWGGYYIYFLLEDSPAVVCTACGRSAWPAGKQLDAVNRWNAQDFQYGPLKEGD